MKDAELLLQLHAWNNHEHPNIGDPDAALHGYGVLLWFQTDEFDSAVERGRAMGADIIEEPRVNPNAQHRGLWWRDPDGCVVVVASAREEVGRQNSADFGGFRCRWISVDRRA